MNEYLNQPRVLVLNKHWRAIFVRTPREAIEMMTSNGTSKKPAALSLDIDLEGNYMNPVGWDEWIQLPVREGKDLFIQSARSKVRLPTVIIARNFDKMPPAKKVAPSLDAFLKREDYKCAYSGVPIDRSNANLDHVMPRSRGGGNTWENMVATHKDVNFKKADMTPEEAGLKLRVKPVAPKPRPVHETIQNTFQIPEWVPFLKG